MTGYPSFYIIRANFLAAILLWISSLEPVQTILPEEKISAVDLGSLILMTSAANLRGLYSAFLAYKANCLRLSFALRFTVETTF